MLLHPFHRFIGIRYYSGIGIIRPFGSSSSKQVLGLASFKCYSTSENHSRRTVDRKGATAAATATKSVEDTVGGNPPTSSYNRSQDNSLYCADLVRKHEYESFLCTLLVPGVDLRNFILAVRSFNVEIALIRDLVSQKDIGLGRLTFWRDAISKLLASTTSSSSNLPRHPVVTELHRTLNGKSVSKKWFFNLLDAREQVMSDAPFKDVGDLEAYCDKSVSPILYLAFEYLGIKSVDVDHAASHLGKALGLANFIRSIPYNSERRRVLVPQELLLKHKVSQENFIRCTNHEGIQDVVFEIASQAHIHYQKAKSLKTSIPKAALPLMLIGTPTDIYLQRLEAMQFNPFHSSLNRRNGLIPLRLYYRKLTGTYY